MSPAQKGFKFDDLFGRGVHLRLIEKSELPFGERSAKIQLKKATRLQLRVHGQFEEAKVSASVGFRPVKSHVGVAQQQVNLQSIGRRDSHADTCTNVDLVSVEVKRLLQRFDDSLCN